MNLPQFGVCLPTEYMRAKELAIQLKRLGEYERAREIYRKVKHDFPSDVDTYKGLAKVEICRKQYHEAVYSLVMWMELIVHAIKQARECSNYRTEAIENIQCLESIENIKIRNYAIPTRNILRLVAPNGRLRDAGLTAAVNKDPYLMLGLCYLRLFPRDVAHYQIPDELITNYENALAGCHTGIDFRGTDYELLVYALGLLMAMANVRGDIVGIEKDGLQTRWDRRPSYAIITQTADDWKSARDGQMIKVLNNCAAIVGGFFACSVVPVHAIPLEKMTANKGSFKSELKNLLVATGQPLTYEIDDPSDNDLRRKLEDLLIVGDAYAMKMSIPISSSGIVKTRNGKSIGADYIARWMTRRYNRNVLCSWSVPCSQKKDCNCELNWIEIVQI